MEPKLEINSNNIVIISQALHHVEIFFNKSVVNRVIKLVLEGGKLKLF